jgi:DNA-binding transcriptional LysR family regulator
MADMTLTQLRAFVTVARLGSVKGAAESLGVTEAAVSGAVAALRRELGDLLFIRAAGGISLTPGGRRLAAGAAEIVGLAEETRHRVRQAARAPPNCGWRPPKPAPNRSSPRCSRPSGGDSPTWTPTPSPCRWRSSATCSATAAPMSRSARRRARNRASSRSPSCASNSSSSRRRTTRSDTGKRLAPAQLAHEPWLLGPAGLDPDTLSGAFLSHIGVEAAKAKAFPSVTASLNAVAGGAGLSIAFHHVVRDELRRGSLAVLDVSGARLTGMLYASALTGERRSTTAAALCRFVTTPAATQAVLTRSKGVPMNEFRPPVHVTIWS